MQLRLPISTATALLSARTAQRCARSIASAAGPLATALRDPALFRESAYVDGRWAAGAAGKTVGVTDPATGDCLGEVPDMDATDCAAAIHAAERALPAWRAKTAHECAAIRARTRARAQHIPARGTHQWFGSGGRRRAAILKAWHGLLIDHQADLALIMTREQASPSPPRPR